MIVTPELKQWIEWLNKRIPDLKKEHNREWLIMAMNGYAEALIKSHGGNIEYYECKHENIEQGHHIDTPCVCKDCGEEV